MYYKIENKKSKVYKELFDLRIKEYAIQDENEIAIKDKSGSDFKNFFGDAGQQNFRRVRQYTGFEFIEPEKINAKIWKRHEKHNEIFIPNRKTKLGREMAEFLLNGLKGSKYDNVINILNLKSLRKFTLPYFEIYGDVILIYLSDGHEPTDENVIEITKREFKQLQTTTELEEIKS